MELNSVVEMIGELPADIITTFTEAAWNLLHKNVQNDDVLIKIQNKHDLPYMNVCDMFGVFIKIIQCYVRNNSENFHAELSKLGFSNHFIEKLPVYCNTINNDITIKNNLISIKWRIDINTTKMNKKRPATVILKLQFTNDSHIIILSLKSLDLLRNNVSMILNEMFKFKKQSFIKNK